MSEFVTTAMHPLQVVRGFVTACEDARPESASHLIHPTIRFRSLIANGADQNIVGRDALMAEYREFFDHFGQPEVLHRNVDPVGSLYRWSTRWRTTRSGETSLFEWHALLAVEDGQINQFDEICTGRLPG